MTQDKLLILTLVATVVTTLGEALAEVGRTRLATDLFHIEGAATAIGRRRARLDRLPRLQNAAGLARTPKRKHCLSVRRRSARHV